MDEFEVFALKKSPVNDERLQQFRQATKEEEDLALQKLNSKAKMDGTLKRNSKFQAMVMCSEGREIDCTHFC